MMTTKITGGYGLFAVAALLTFASGVSVVRAADTEAFEPQNVSSTSRPNVLFVIDSTVQPGISSRRRRIVDSAV